MTTKPVIEKIGLFGGTFDPPHLGHLIVAQALAERLDLARVVFIPCGCPPHKPGRMVSAGAHRLAMLRLATADNPRFEVSDWELPQTRPTYTIHTVAHFRQVYPGARLLWLIGADNLADLPTWYEFERLIGQVEIVTACRGGFEIDRLLEAIRGRLAPAEFEKLRANLVPTPRIEIAAQDLRARVHAGKSLRYLVPADVEEYVRREGLYR